ncbi:MAG: 5-(carboxyamino)imidazole ribonucleotide mutase [Thaumarchaeota archaeon]|jgi:5-(carboxyamino)imidazole ribonucleotide mutase|nr:5-(carboxyamino)imidazole ribonucleotide mutase [Candidatus Terraquivivens yellowstonensis]MCL7397754.1 5-(carboxyamino)imidazole ribonucleotide mutase [Candidatus Terraquivivens yellowstonensis]MCL7399960.1 5-(carboxyamino)imidazole ribonucleotide mutase [Candidatus Terraquivivens yellowstonensis]
MPIVSLVIGSESDRPIGDKIRDLLKSFGVEVEYMVISAHRTPEELRKYVKESRAEAFIAVAGLSAALPGAIASTTIKPVIGVPREVKLMGLDSLFSIVQMPPGVPVACVGLDNATNAAILAIEILALKYPELEKKLEEYRENMRRESAKKLE